VAVVTQGKRALGQWRGRVRMAEDFDEPLPDGEQKAWEGES
jgi:hypothetical protein